MNASPAGSAAASGRIASIDILRGIAILWVIGYHTWTDLRFPNVYPQQSDAFREVTRQLGDADVAGAIAAAFEALLRVGYLGVPLFMLLSGYSLTLTALARGTSSEREQRAVPRRLRKVMLPYWAGFAITVAFACALATVQWQRHGGAPLVDYLRYGDISLKGDQLFAGALLVPRIFRNEWQFAPSGALWFVLVVVQYYLLFPLLLRALQRFGAIAIVAGTLAITVVSLAAMIAASGDLLQYRSWVEMGAPFRIVEFGLGMAMASGVVRHRDIAGIWAAPLGAAASVVAGGAIFVAACMIGLDDGYVSAMHWPLVIAGLGLMAMPLLAKQPGTLEAAAPMRAFAWVGVVSYTVLIINEPLRSITHTMRAEGAPTAWVASWVVLGLLPLTFLLARPLARVLGLIERKPPAAMSVGDFIANEETTRATTKARR